MLQEQQRQRVKWWRGNATCSIDKEAAGGGNSTGAAAHGMAQWLLE